MRLNDKGESEHLLQHPTLTLENQFKLDKVQNKHKDIKMPFALKNKNKRQTTKNWWRWE